MSDLAKKEGVLSFLIPYKWKSKDDVCPFCHGRGERDYAIYEWDVCDYCEGTGKIIIPNYAGISFWLYA